MTPAQRALPLLAPLSDEKTRFFIKESSPGVEGKYGLIGERKVTETATISLWIVVHPNRTSISTHVNQHPANALSFAKEVSALLAEFSPEILHPKEENSQ